MVTLLSFTFGRRDSVFWLYNHYGQVYKFVFASVLGFNIHQMCFACVSKDEEESREEGGTCKLRIG